MAVNFQVFTLHEAPTHSPWGFNLWQSPAIPNSWLSRKTKWVFANPGSQSSKNILKSSGSCQMFLFDFSCIISSHGKVTTIQLGLPQAEVSVTWASTSLRDACWGNPRILANYICNSMIVMNIVEPSINYSTVHYVMVKQAIWCQSGFRERLGHIMWRGESEETSRNYLSANGQAAGRNWEKLPIIKQRYLRRTWW